MHARANITLRAVRVHAKGEQIKNLLEREAELLGAANEPNPADRVGRILSVSRCAMFGFGLDSIIETIAAGLLLWRLGVEARGADRETVERTEHRVHQFVGVTFALLAIYVTAQAGWTLWKLQPPKESVTGIVLAVASLVIMPLVSWGKLRAALVMVPWLVKEGCEALSREGTETS